MTHDQSPLFSLSIGEYRELTKQLLEVMLQNLQHQQSKEKASQDDQEVLTIDGLTTFLYCSKVSIHNYKKKGLPYYRVGRKLLFKKEEVLFFMKGLKNRKY